MSLLNRFLAACVIMAFAPASPSAAESAHTTLMFDVYLDGKKIGYHRFEIDGPRSNAAVRSEASFDVKFLFVTAFSSASFAFNSSVAASMAALSGPSDGKPCGRERSKI